MARRFDPFGTTGTGERVERISLQNGALQAQILTWGAVVQDLRLAGHSAPLVLGFDRFDHYLKHSPYFGAIAGRYANRIGDARLEIDGRSYDLDANFLSKHTLHGGRAGVGKRVWNIADAGTSHVVLTLDDRDGEMGFPSTCRHVCSYTLKPDAVLEIALSSQTDAPTAVSLAPHSYFNLDGDGDCREHSLRVDAGTYLPVDLELIPTGEIADVEGTAFDFRNGRTIGTQIDLDHNFCLARQRRSLRQVASLRSGRSGVSLDIATTEPGLQIYTGSKIATPVAGLTGRPYEAYAGVAIEPQNWPDAPRRDNFPDAILRPGGDLRQISQFRFRRD